MAPALALGASQFLRIGRARGSALAGRKRNFNHEELNHEEHEEHEDRKL
jgi:hypothetical protein